VVGPVEAVTCRDAPRLVVAGRPRPVGLRRSSSGRGPASGGWWQCPQPREGGEEVVLPGPAGGLCRCPSNNAGRWDSPITRSSTSSPATAAELDVSNTSRSVTRSCFEATGGSTPTPVRYVGRGCRRRIASSTATQSAVAHREGAFLRYDIATSWSLARGPTLPATRPPHKAMAMPAARARLYGLDTAAGIADPMR
jgi:hypothetical protein